MHVGGVSFVQKSRLALFSECAICALDFGRQINYLLDFFHEHTEFANANSGNIGITGFTTRKKQSSNKMSPQ